jgi:hypothetical protein
VEKIVLVVALYNIFKSFLKFSYRDIQLFFLIYFHQMLLGKFFHHEKAYVFNQLLPTQQDVKFL